ncbi:MAG: endonuclease/exonuclease/phosphatase family protein [Gemmatimonadota bacterium]
MPFSPECEDESVPPRFTRARYMQYPAHMRWSWILLIVVGCSRLEPMLPAGQSCRSTEIIAADEGVPERVTWVEAPDTSDRRALDLWCETVGPAVLASKPAGADTGSVVADSIAIVSWNTRVGGGDIARLVRDLRAGRFTNGDSVLHFVLLLQEVYRASDSLPSRLRIGVPARIAAEPPGSARRHDIVATATALGLALLYVPSMRNGPPDSASTAEDRGNAILSTMELDDPRAIDLPFEVQRRVVVTAELDGETVAGDDWELEIASVHLDTRSRAARAAASAGLGRRRQAMGMVDQLKGEDALVVAGDLNTWAPAIFERALPFLRSVFTDSPRAIAEHTFENGALRSRLDYMFFRLPDDWSATYQRIGRQYGSDHYPLLGWVRFK